MKFNLQIAVWRLTGVLPAGSLAEVTADDWSYIVLRCSPEQEFDVRQAAQVMIESGSLEDADKRLSVKKREIIYAAQEASNKNVDKAIHQLEEAWIEKQRRAHHLKGKAPLFSAFLHAFASLEKPDREKMMQEAKYLIDHALSE